MRKPSVSKLFLSVTMLIVLIVASGCLPFGVSDMTTLRQQLLDVTETPASQQASEPAPTDAPLPTVEPLLSQEAAVDSNVLPRLYEAANPSVVNIVVTQKVQISSSPFLFGPQTPQEYYQQGQGSGFVYDEEGHIITNNHVVADADEVQVTFADSVTAPAMVVATDPDSDLAVIKVDVDRELRPLPLGESDELKVGQQVVAIGNPYGLEGTMTWGIVSALGRLLPTSSATSDGGTYSIPDIVQTDAAVNPGNSGGPLLNLQGEVVGVNTAIQSTDQSSSGVAFAVPSNIVKQVIPALIEQGYYEHPWLGISGLTLNADLAEAMDLSSDQRGLLVVEVTPDSPASEAGLRPSNETAELYGQEIPIGGDVIVRIADQPVRKFDDLISYLSRETSVGQTVTLEVLRDGSNVELDVTLAARPEGKS